MDPKKQKDGAQYVEMYSPASNTVTAPIMAGSSNGIGAVKLPPPVPSLPRPSGNTDQGNAIQIRPQVGADGAGSDQMIDPDPPRAVRSERQENAPSPLAVPKTEQPSEPKDTGKLIGMGNHHQQAGDDSSTWQPILALVLFVTVIGASLWLARKK